jgi:hypothetical protein
MTPLPVVPDLDELEYLASRGCARLKQPVNEQLLRYCREKAFHNSIIPAVTDPAHTRRKPCRSQEPAIRYARILHSAIRVMQSASCSPMTQGHLKSTERELLVQPRAH